MANKAVEVEHAPNGDLHFFCDGDMMAWLHKESLELRDLKFWPNGEVLISIQQICWTLIANVFYPYVWDAPNARLSIAEREENGVWIHIEAESLDGKLDNISDLEVFYASDKQCLVYRVKEVLKVKGEYRWYSTAREIDGTYQVMLEYSDPFFMHIVGPATPVTGRWPGIWLNRQASSAADWRKRWSMFVFEQEDGVYLGYPHNHSLNASPWKVKQGGFMGLLDDQVGNPIYRFFGDTTRKGIEICLWGYDAHFFYGKECEELVNPGAGYAVLKPGEVYEAEYEISALTSEQSRSIMERVVIPPITESNEEYLNMPVYTSDVNRFDRKLLVDDMQSFAWRKFGEGAVWEKGFGYDDAFSLKLEGQDDVSSCTWLIYVGSEHFMQALEPGQCYKLSARVYKAAGSSSAGFRMGAGYGVAKYPDLSGEVYPVAYTWAEDIQEAEQWKLFEIKLPPVPEMTYWGTIEFHLQGPGSVWIDNVEFKLMA